MSIIFNRQMMLNGTFLPVKLCVATGFWQRLRGLLFTAHLGDYQGMFIQPCSDVHSIGMNYSLDVVFLNHQLNVIKLINLKPNRISVCRGANSVIELAEGSIEKYRIKEDDRLSFGLGEYNKEVVS